MDWQQAQRRRAGAANAKAPHALTRGQYGFLAKFVDEVSDLAWGQRVALMLMLADATGLRVSELCAAKRGHLETKWVDDELGTAWTLRVKGRGSKTGVVPMPSVVIEALTRYLAARGLPTDVTSWDAEAPIGLAKAFKRVFM